MSNARQRYVHSFRHSNLPALDGQTDAQNC